MAILDDIGTSPDNNGGFDSVCSSWSSCASSSISSCSTTSTNRTVRFHPRVRAKRAIRYTMDEQIATWYDQDELDEIRLEIQKFKSMNDTSNEGTNQDATQNNIDDDHRGLEEPNEQVRLLARVTVMQEQERQKSAETHSYDANRIAKAYMIATQSSKSLAQSRGYQDAMIALQLSNQTTATNPEDKLGDCSVCQNRANQLRERRRDSMKQKLAIRKELARKG